MKLAITFIIILLTLLSFGQKTQELKIKVELTKEINEEEIPPFCGTMAFFTAFEFNVIKVINGTYDKSKIYICIPCARDLYQAGKLKAGKSYTYKLVKPEIEELHCDKELAPEGFIIYNIQN